MFRPVHFILLLMAVCSSILYSCSSPAVEKKETVKKVTRPDKIIATFEYTTSGCFHQNTCKFLLLERDSVVFARITNVNKTPAEKELSSGQVKAFENFVTDLKNLKEDFGCTTVDSYLVTYKNETIKKSDGSCSWNGFDNLFRFLFNADHMSAFN